LSDPHLGAGIAADGSWSEGRCGGGPHLPTWRANPAVEVLASRAAPIAVDLSQAVGNASRLTLGFILLTREAYDARDAPARAVAASKFLRASVVSARLRELAPGS